MSAVREVLSWYLAVGAACLIMVGPGVYKQMKHEWSWKHNLVMPFLFVLGWLPLMVRGTLRGKKRE